MTYQKFGRAGLGTIIDPVKEVQCYSLAINSLDETVDLVEELVSR